jgi:hypothetical protein
MPGADTGVSGRGRGLRFGKTSCICFFHVVIIALELERGWEHGDALGAPGAERCRGEPKPETHKTARPFARPEKRDRTDTQPRYGACAKADRRTPWPPKEDALRLPFS